MLSIKGNWYKRTAYCLRQPWYILGFIVVFNSGCKYKSTTDERPNVLFIICDDLNTIINPYTANSPVKTPSIDRLARQSMVFNNAHCNNSICAPSRASLFSGLYPHTTDNFWFTNWRQNEMLSERTMIQQVFMDAGYNVYGTGKLLHHSDPTKYHEFGHLPNQGPFPWNGNDRRKNENENWYVNQDPHPNMLELFDGFPIIPFKWEQTFAPLSEIPSFPRNGVDNTPGYEGWMLNGQSFNYTSDDERDRMPDEKSVDWAIERLDKAKGGPFFLAVGFCKPHTPLYVPDKYFHMYPLDSIEIPEAMSQDVEDCADILVQNESLYGYQRYQFLKSSGDSLILKKWLQAYYASISFIDHQVGRLLQALEKNDYLDNTIIVFTSDNGYMMGQKNHLHKHTLWSQGTRIPLFISAPGYSKGRCDQPVSLIDLYPTLASLCNHDSGDTQVDGHSLIPLLQDPIQGKWGGRKFAISELKDIDFTNPSSYISQGVHYSMCSEEWRYTICADGDEELYNLKSDPKELTNLSSIPKYIETKEKLKNELLQSVGIN